MDTGQIITVVILMVLVAVAGLIARRVPVQPAPSTGSAPTEPRARTRRSRVGDTDDEVS